MRTNCLQIVIAIYLDFVSSEYYGTYIGSFTNQEYKIQGHLYAVDDAKLFIKNFFFDGDISDAHFWVGEGKQPSPIGTVVPYPYGFQGKECPALPKFENKDVLLKLPSSLKLSNIQWLSVWSRRFTINFGSILIPNNLKIPRPLVLNEFKRLAHGLRSGNVTLLDTKTIYIPNLHYDGTGPPAFFWIGKGTEPSPDGIKLANEVGRKDPLRRYLGEDIHLKISTDVNIHDMDWLSVWCVLARQDFGHVMFPKNFLIPPALGQTKITTTEVSKLRFSNCVDLIDKRMQVRWALNIEDAVIQLSGRINENQYMAFGISPREDK